MYFHVQEEPPFDPSEEFNEIIKTSNGNEFYVVKANKLKFNEELEARASNGTASLQGEEEQQGEGEGKIGGEDEEDAGEGEDAFLTEVDGQKESGVFDAGAVEVPEYISSIDIPEDVIIRVKKV